MNMTKQELIETLDYTFSALIEGYEKETGGDLYTDFTQDKPGMNADLAYAYRKLSDLWDIVSRSIETGKDLTFTK